MAVNINRANVGYGLSSPLQELAPQPIVAQRAPTTQDSAGTFTTEDLQISFIVLN